jgi:hypothetical protein
MLDGCGKKRSLSILCIYHHEISLDGQKTRVQLVKPLPGCLQLGMHVRHVTAVPIHSLQLFLTSYYTTIQQCKSATF